MRRRQIVVAVLMVAAMAPLPGASPGVAAAPVPGAHAWLVRLSVPGGQNAGIADVDSRIGNTPAASALPFIGGGQSAFAASAPQADKDRVTGSGPSWSDPTGSMTLKGAYGEAWATAHASSARASLTAATGTGIVLASKLLTWDQQVQLGNEMLAINNAVIDPINARLMSLAPVAAMAGLQFPQFEKLGALGLIDIGGGELADATADVSNSVGYAASKATATVAHVRLFGGFIEAGSVSVQADSETSQGTPAQSATAMMGSLKIAGVAVTADGSRITVAGNGLVDRATVQPALDMLLGQLAQHGITLKVLQQSGAASTQAATALEVDVASPPLTISVGHAEATPPEEQPAPPVGVTAESAPPAAPAVETPLAIAPEAVPPAPAFAGTPLPAALPVRRAPTASRTVRRVPLPPAVVKALEATFLILLAAGGAGAVVIPMLAAPAWRQRTPTTRR